MSIMKKYFRSADAAFRFLSQCAESERDYLFRGHRNSDHRLGTTLSRFTTTPHEDWMSYIDEILETFHAGLIKAGIDPIPTDSRLDWMEYARHYGVPTPCIDFIYSPYVALFFAFDGIRKKYSKIGKPKYSVVYVLDVAQLATLWARFAAGSRSEDFAKLFHKFRFPDNKKYEELFKYGFPAGVLQLIPHPGRYSNRMQRQFGALLYDTLNYPHLKETRGISDLEEFIEKQKEPDETLPDGKTQPGPPALIKVFINQEWVGEVFTKIELMGITGGSLFLNPEGVAFDIINSYVYNPKAQYLRKIGFPPIDESKLHEI